MYSCRLACRFGSSQHQILAVGACFGKQEDPVWQIKESLQNGVFGSPTFRLCSGPGEGRDWSRLSAELRLIQEPTRPRRGVCFRDTYKRAAFTVPCKPYRPARGGASKK